MLLRDLKTDTVKKLYAGKIILESYLRNKDADKRRENLQREIEILSAADRRTSVTLVEQVHAEADRTILI